MSKPSNRGSSSSLQKYAKLSDALNEDHELKGQKFYCVSFLAPEKIIKKKELVYFQAFLKQWEFAKTTETLRDFMGFVSHKYKVNVEKLMQDYLDFVLEEKEKLVQFSSLHDDYTNFVEAHEEQLQQLFDKEVPNQPNVRGVKVRGTFPTVEEARIRCSALREMDPAHDVYVGQVGKWMPFDGDAYRSNDVEYLEPELNQLMHEKKKNEDRAKVEFQARVLEAKEKAMEENKKIAEQTGQKLTQTIDENGQLVGLSKTTQEKALQEVANQQGGLLTTSDIVRELFMGDNIVVPQKKKEGTEEKKEE